MLVLRIHDAALKVIAEIAPRDEYSKRLPVVEWLSCMAGKLRKADRIVEAQCLWDRDNHLQ